MANPEIVEKLKAVAKDPEALKRLKKAQITARETIEYIREAGRVNLGDLKKVHYNI